jgi:hypothetical protein
MGECRGVGKIVYRYEVNIIVAERGPHNIAADAPEPVYTYFYSHFVITRLRKIITDQKVEDISILDKHQRIGFGLRHTRAVSVAAKLLKQSKI